MKQWWITRLSVINNDEQYVEEPITFTAIILIIVLSLLVGFSLYWNIKNLEMQQINLATAEARANWNKDQAFRGWASKHGGLYVKPDQRTPPSPYLAHISNRDIVSTDGMKLTLMNPAYMMRQMTEEYEATYGIKASITGKVLLNPINEPDAWERKVLDIYDTEPHEVIEQSVIDGEPYIRLMKPIMMTQGCVKCHGHLGFKVGDVRGGVSVSIPLNPYYAAMNSTIRSMKITHATIWVMGLISVLLFSWFARRREIERWHLLSELEKNQDMLELRVEERTKELKDKELELLNAQARELQANKMVSLGEMASGMAHEINSPLQSIILAIHKIGKNIKNKKFDHVDDTLSLVEKSVNKITSIIDSLRKMSRNSSQDSYEWVQIGDLIEEVTCITLERYSRGNISFAVNYHNIDNAYKLYCQSIQIEQIIMNLFNNAYDAVQSLDTKWIHLDVQEVGDIIELSVTDSGKGIAVELQGKIFEPLFTSKDIGKGTGLGLSISSEIAQKHGGRLYLDTESLHTRFVLEIPKSQEQEQDVGK